MTLVLHNDSTSFFCTECKETIERTRDNPFPEHKCKTVPLDLRAVKQDLDERVFAFHSHIGAACWPSKGEDVITVLLAHVHALRSILQRAPVNSRYKDWYDEAAAVLAQATDV